jgi:hypothetical protein
MYEQCESDPYSYYYDIFVKQFLQTLGQLSAGLLTSTLAIPVYSYYVRRNNIQKNKAEYENVDEEDLNDTQKDTGYQGDDEDELNKNNQEEDDGNDSDSSSDSL